MKKIIKTAPKCEQCGGELALVQVDIDFINCLFILYCDCIVCGEETYIILSLEDFIELNKLMLGGNDEPKKEEPQ